MDLVFGLVCLMILAPVAWAYCRRWDREDQEAFNAHMENVRRQKGRL